MKNKMENLANRVKGCIFGLALGDAFGMPLEFYKRQHIYKIWHGKVIDFVHENGVQFKNGDYTDDTEMALCIIDAILEDEDIDPETIKDNFISWAERVWDDPDNNDIGNHTSEVLADIRNGQDWQKSCKKYMENRN